MTLTSPEAERQEESATAFAAEIRRETAGLLASAQGHQEAYANFTRLHFTFDPRSGKVARMEPGKGCFLPVEVENEGVFTYRYYPDIPEKKGSGEKTDTIEARLPTADMEDQQRRLLREERYGNYKGGAGATLAKELKDGRERVELTVENPASYFSQTSLFSEPLQKIGNLNLEKPEKVAYGVEQVDGKSLLRITASYPRHVWQDREKGAEDRFFKSQAYQEWLAKFGDFLLREGVLTKEELAQENWPFEFVNVDRQHNLIIHLPPTKETKGLAKLGLKVLRKAQEITDVRLTQRGALKKGAEPMEGVTPLRQLPFFDTIAKVRKAREEWQKQSAGLLSLENQKEELVENLKRTKEKRVKNAPAIEELERQLEKLRGKEETLRAEEEKLQIEITEVIGGVATAKLSQKKLETLNQTSKWTGRPDLFGKD